MGQLGLLLFVCSLGNNTSCNSAGSAYYLTTPLPAYVERIRKEDTAVAYSAIFLASLYEQKATVGIGYNLTASIDSRSTTPYVRWTYEF